MEGLLLRPLREGEVAQAQWLARSVWQDVFQTETGIKVDYPLKPEVVLRAYLEMDPEGCLSAWSGELLVGTIYAHSWGDVGWVGPMEVLTDWQGRGVGSALLEAAELYLQGVGCTQIGLEAMTERHATVGFYASRGYRQAGPAPFFEKRLEGRAQVSGVSEIRLPDLGPHEALVESFGRVIRPGLDLQREVRATLELGLGRAFIHRDREGGLDGLALLHTESVKELGGHQLRLLMSRPGTGRPEATRGLLGACENESVDMGAGRMFFTTMVDLPLIEMLVDRGYRILGTNARMLKGEMDHDWAIGQVVSWTG